MIYVTHDQVEAMTLADRIVILNECRIEQIGTPMEIYPRPASRFVAGFMDRRHEFLPVTSRLWRSPPPALATVRSLRLLARRGTDGIELGVRPEALTVVAEGGDIGHCERRGAPRRANACTCPAGGRYTGTAQDPALRRAARQHVRLKFDPAALHLFAPTARPGSGLTR